MPLRQVLSYVQVDILHFVLIVSPLFEDGWNVQSDMRDLLRVPPPDLIQVIGREGKLFLYNRLSRAVAGDQFFLPLHRGEGDKPIILAFAFDYEIPGPLSGAKIASSVSELA